jgi:hypothetical protein
VKTGDSFHSWLIDKERGASFLKKRTKELLPLWPKARAAASRKRLFAAFSSEKEGLTDF